MIKNATALSYDICVVGSGPAGMTAALELAEKGLSVALVESGQQVNTTDAQRLSDAEIVTPDNHSVMDEAVLRRLGGTSGIWGGRCVPMDSIDFQKRNYVEGSGWPFDETALNQHYSRACEILNVGNASFSTLGCDSRKNLPQHLSTNFVETEELCATKLERWSTEAKIWVSHKNKVITHPLITVMSDLTCVGFEQSALHADIDFALIKSTSSPEVTPVKLKAKFFVLACGGVETTRLILNSTSEATGLKLSSTKFVGRYYMGHPSGKIADIQFYGKPDQTVYGFEMDGGVYIRRRITFTHDCLLKNKLLNIAFWLDNATISDWRHGSGVLSAAYLAIITPLVGRLLAPAAIRTRIATGGGKDIFWHFLNCLKNPIKTISFCICFVYKRYLAKPRLPGFFTYSKSNRYALHYHSEQAPNWSNTVELSDNIDEVGMRRARINLNWYKQDIDSIINAHEVLDKALQAKNIGRLIYYYQKEDLEKKIYHQAVDGFHQIGTLRMSTNESTGVTDSFGRLFGTRNGFVASSAIFPTSGQANPTLTLVALTVRQAKYISEIISNRDSSRA
jgi:hypothetical protein